jgi:hypothetical protein
MFYIDKMDQNKSADLLITVGDVGQRPLKVPLDSPRARSASKIRTHSFTFIFDNVFPLGDIDDINDGGSDQPFRRRSSMVEDGPWGHDGAGGSANTKAIIGVRDCQTKAPQ